MSICSNGNLANSLTDSLTTIRTNSLASILAYNLTNCQPNTVA